jgi:hypothetical protein
MDKNHNNGKDMAKEKELTMKTIGRAERISFPEYGIEQVHARIDTGAKTSSVWASDVQEKDGQLEVLFFSADSPHYTGEKVTFDDYEETVVASSNGHAQRRFKVRLLVKIKGKKVRAWFTLADRSTQVYPVLIGRNVLLGKFVVDVKKGRVLKEEEHKRTEQLRSKANEEKS